MLRNFFAKRKIKKCITVSAQLLAKDYGASDEYTEGQVKTVLAKLGFKKDLEEMAIAVFCSEEAAKAYGIKKALIKQYRGYQQKHCIEVGSYGGGFNGGGD